MRKKLWICFFLLSIVLLLISSLFPLVIGNKNNLNNNLSMNNQQIYNYILERNNTCFGPQEDFKIDIRNQNIANLELHNVVIKNQQTNSLSGAPWPMYCHDTRHTGRSPYSTIENMGVEKWRFDTRMQASGSPIIDEQGIIYIGASEFFAVYPNGTEKWQFKNDGRVTTAPAIDENGNIYFGVIWGNYLYALDYNGTLKWKYPQGSTWASPTIGDDGIIYAPATDNWIVAAFYPNGTAKWGFRANEKVYSSPAIGPDNTIYFGSWDRHLYAVYPNNGTLKWKYDTGGGIGTSPCIDNDGIIYISSHTNGYLNAMYPNGTLKWRTYTNGGTSPTIGPDGTIYTGWTNLYAINSENGSVKWTFDPGPDSRIEEGTPCISAEGTIYFGTHIGETDGGEIIAVNPDGSLKWRIMIASTWAMSAPVIGVDGTVYAGSWNDGPPYGWGYLHAIYNYDPNAPSAPEIDGPTSGEIEIQYNFSFKSISPLNRDIYYVIDWDQNQGYEIKGPYPSGEEIIVKHSWRYKDNYTIKARAIDTENLWGPWGKFEIDITKNQQSNYKQNYFLKNIVLNQFLQQIINEIYFINNKGI